MARRAARKTVDRKPARQEPPRRETGPLFVLVLSGPNLQLLGTEQWVLSPFENRLWLQTMSHKALRLSLPLLYLVVFFANMALLNIGVFRALLVAQLGFYGAAMLAHFKPELARKLRWLVVPYEICFLNCAALVGFYRFLTRRYTVMWERPSLRSIHPTG